MTTNENGLMKISFSPPDISEAEINEVVDTLRSGWITTGPKTKKLEKLLAEWIGVGLTEKGKPRCVALNSQTICAQMALRILGVGGVSGGSCEDEIIVPAYTYTASASVVTHVQAKLKLVDVQADSLQMDYTALENAITEKTKVIIPVDIAGIPCDYDKIFEIVNRKKALFKPSNKIQQAIGRIIVLADGAHSLGANYKGKMVGNVADFTAFSFHAVKNFTTAEGGCLSWKHIDGICDDEIYQTLQHLSLHGQTKDALTKEKPGAWEYDIIAPYFKCNLTDVAASIGLAQFSRYPAMLERRKQLVAKYDLAFKPLGVKVLNHYNDNYQSSGHLYITRLFDKNGNAISAEKRNEVIMQMVDRGIACNVHYKPLPMFTAYKNLGFDIKDYPNAYANYVNEITLPLNTCLTDEQVDYLIENFTEIVRGL